MPTLTIETEINADIKICFDVARDITVYQESLENTEEKAVDGKVSGLVGLNDWVCWEAKHFGVVQHLTFKITEFKAPHYFVEEMVEGFLKSFRHEHHFSENKGKTLMVEVFKFRSPFGLLGKLADKLFLNKYIIGRTKRRNQFLKNRAESLAVNKRQMAL